MGENENSKLAEIHAFVLSINLSQNHQLDKRTYTPVNESIKSQISSSSTLLSSRQSSEYNESDAISIVTKRIKRSLPEQLKYTVNQRHNKGLHRHSTTTKYTMSSNTSSSSSSSSNESQSSSATSSTTTIDTTSPQFWYNCYGSQSNEITAQSIPRRCYSDGQLNSKSSISNDDSTKEIHVGTQEFWIKCYSGQASVNN